MGRKVGDGDSGVDNGGGGCLRMVTLVILAVMLRMAMLVMSVMSVMQVMDHKLW